MTIQRRTLGLWLMLLALTGARAAERIPVEAFFQNPEMASPRVSPGGKSVAFLSPLDGRMSVLLFDLGTGKIEPLARAYDADITQIFWKSDDRLVFSADPGGTESRVIMTVQVSTRHLQVLSENFRERRQDAAFANLVGILPFDPAHILVYGRSSAGGWHVGLFLVSLATGERRSLFGADPDTGGWAADGNGEIRYRLRGDGDRIIHEFRAEKSSRWTPVAEYGGGIGMGNSPVQFWGFSADNTAIFLTKPDADDRDALYRFDTRTADWGAPLFTAESGGIDAVYLSWDHARVEGVRYGPDGRETTWFDPRLAGIAKMLRATVPEKHDVTIESADRENKVFTVYVHSDVNPGEYYLLDLRGRTQFVRLGQRYPRIPVDQLRPMKPIEYRARDGLVIHGYLTRPAAAAGAKVPLIILPHGGPYGIRDRWGYDPEVQFLASRGYAVLQPNYRGSGGYGLKFLLAGRHEWGGKMQDDLTDAVQWAVAQGFADPARVCIYGASYGGYAALAGAVFTPDLYRCAVNYVGLSDLGLWANWQHEANAESRAFYHNLVGDDREYIASRSPVNFVERIKIPTLHAYGENDPRIDIKNWKELERELKKHGKTYEYLREENEGHGFKTEKVRIRFYRTLEAFLDKYLAPATPPAP